MRKFLVPVFCILSFAFSAYAFDCLDVRAADLGSCRPGEERVYLQGACTKPYEVENTYCSPVNSAPYCMNLRAIDVAACADGQKRIYVQGKCNRAYEIEHTYCAKR